MNAGKVGTFEHLCVWDLVFLLYAKQFSLDEGVKAIPLPDVPLLWGGLVHHLSLFGADCEPKIVADRVPVNAVLHIYFGGTIDVAITSKTRDGNWDFAFCLKPPGLKSDP